MAYRYFLRFYYGERLIDHPTTVAVKLLMSRLLFVSHMPLVMPDKHFLTTCYGSRMYVNLFTSPITMDRALGVYEYWMARLFTDLVREGMTILDIGAHKGSYSLLFASLMHDTGRVLAFEPDPANSVWIRKNIEANNYQCIELRQFALSDSEGTATFYAADGLGSLMSNPSVRVVHKEPLPVQTRTLDNVLNEEGIRGVDLMKIDVEGADLLVLRGAERTLRSMNVRLLMDVDVHSNAERKELFDLLQSCGYEIYRIGRELQPITKPSQLYLFDEDDKPIRMSTQQIVRDIYATKAG